MDNVYREKQTPSTLRYVWKALQNDTLAMTGYYGVLLLFILCITADWLIPYTINQQFLGYQLLPPSWSSEGNISFFLGTDDLGRDVLSRLLSGAAPTFGSAFLVTLSSAILGLGLGAVIGLTRGWRSAILSNIFATLFSIPSLLLAIVIVAFIGPRLGHAMLAVGLAILPHIVQTVYQAISEELDKGYVIAARLDGASSWTIFWDSILPNIVTQLVSEFTRAFSTAILSIATLGFLELGAQLPSTEWGLMLSESLELFYVAPWCVMLPGFAIFSSVLCVNLLGDGINRAIVSAESE